MKLLVAPLLTLGLALLVKLIFPTLSGTVIKAIFICMAMPSAAMNLSFAEMFGGDREAAVRNVLLSTILSVVTIALLMFLADVIPALG
jgi:predicted permease